MKHSSHIDEIIDSMKERGFRITKVRRAIAAELSSSTQPRSALELLETLSGNGLKVNKTTVYRELDFLRANHFVTEIDLLDGMKRYELLRSDHHHHHLVCTECKTIKCVEMANDLDEIERRLQRRHEFTVQSHVLEFFGLCSACSKGGRDARSCRH